MTIDTQIVTFKVTDARCPRLRSFVRKTALKRFQEKSMGLAKSYRKGLPCSWGSISKGTCCAKGGCIVGMAQCAEHECERLKEPCVQV